ncbi:MAG: sodium:solute symporter [Phycisphaerales bacterium]
MNLNPHFTTIDWFTLGGYGLLLILASWWFSRREQHGTDDYFLARRGVPAWAAAISLLATSLSAVTFIGGPETAYKSDLTYLIATLGGVVGVSVVAVFFVPAFYRQEVTSIYELVGHRFGPHARVLTSVTFMVGRIFASGARLFVGALPAALILFGDTQPAQLTLAIVTLTLVAVAYTIVGGIRTVIWTDVVQTVVFVGAAIIALVLLFDRIPASTGAIIEALQNPAEGEPSKLRLVTLGVDPARDGGWIDFSEFYTLLTALTGLALFNMAAFGTDQDLIQRSLTCRNAAAGARSAVGGILVGIPVTFLFMAVGLLLFIFYRRPDLMGVASPDYTPPDEQRIFLTFILRELPPGLTGLMIAGLFAAGLSSINSALNAMSSTFVTDLYRRWRPSSPERHYVFVGRCAVAGWGVVLAAFAVFCIYWQRASGDRLIDFALKVMIFAYSGLLAVFLSALFTSRGRGWSAIVALATGFGVTLLLQPWEWAPWKGERSIAFPWVMLIATAIAFAVCILPPSRDGDTVIAE